MFLSYIVLYLCTSSWAIKLRNVNNQDKAKLILFQGERRFELEGKECPVGITLKTPERFSCACLTGVWAFYDQLCAPPVKVIGGVNHCFEMPPLWIHQIMVWSNPFRVFDTTLTVFEGAEDHVKLKVYRNTHVTVTNKSHFVTNNSSWTLLAPDGSKVCLNSRRDKMLHGDEPESLGFLCHYSEVNRHIVNVSTLVRGCTRKLKEVKPDKCQNLEGPNGEFVCTQPQVLANFARLRLFSKHTVRNGTSKTSSTTSPAPTSPLLPQVTLEEPVDLHELGGNPLQKAHRSVSLEFSWDKKSLEARSKEMKLIEDYSTRPPPKPLQPMKVTDVSSDNSPATTISIFVDFPPGPNEESVTSTSGSAVEHNNYPKVNHNNTTADLVVKSSDLSTSRQLNQPVEDGLGEDIFFIFGFATLPKSSPIVVTNMLVYHRDKINTLLNLNRENDDRDGGTATQMHELLSISMLIMQRTCSLVSAEFFKKSLQIFVSVQQKYVQWNPPVLANYQFQRIRESLLECLKRAEPFEFVHEADCGKPNTVHINGTAQPLNLDAVFRSQGFEPMIESVWKLVVNAHSYCYADFSHLYNDHHQYTALLTSIFTNMIYDLWFRKFSLRHEYNGVAGNVVDILENTERCIAASRMVSAYPWHLSRPDFQHRTIPVKRRRRDLRSKNIRVQLPVGFEQTRRESAYYEKMRNSFEQKKVSGGENVEWKTARKTLGGLGFCLKKFDEPKTMLNEMCW